MARATGARLVAHAFASAKAWGELGFSRGVRLRGLGLLVAGLAGAMPVVSRASAIVYVRESNPWGNSVTDTAMDTLYGTGTYDVKTFTEIGSNFSSVLGSYGLVVLQGSDSSGTSFLSFMDQNRSALESWVTGGGKAFMYFGANGVPNGDYDLGFGITAKYPSYANFGSVVEPLLKTSPADAPSVMQGGFFGHSTVTTSGASANFTTLIEGYTTYSSGTLSNYVGKVLVGGQVGSGYVVAGGITLPNFWTVKEGTGAPLQTLVNVLNFAGTSGGTSSTPGSASEINTAQASYEASKVGSSVTPVFDGGTLLADTASVTSDFTIKGTGGTIEAQNGIAATFSGVISNAANETGSLTLTNSGAGGSITLAGVNTYTGSTTVSSGATVILTGSLASNDVGIASGATLTNTAGGLASTATLTNAGTVNLGADDAIAALVNSGTLHGAGHTLTAATYALNNGSVIQANLGAGTVTTNGSVALQGTSAAGTVDVASGTLTLGAAERLTDTAHVTLNGSLVLGGNETIDSLHGSGVLQLGAHTLTLNTGAYAGSASGAGGIAKNGSGALTLAGANTYTGATNLNGGTTTLSGALASTAVNVASGATLDNQSGGLATGSTLANAGSVNLGADTSIAAFTNSGTLTGAGRTLTAGTYALKDGSAIHANLGTGTMTTNGNVALHGASGAGTVDVASGTLTLGAAERLADTAHVALTGNLVLGGNETINSLHGSGALQLGAHMLTLNAGAYAGSASGAGGITKSGSGDLSLSGENHFTGATNLNGGTTTLSGALASTAVNVASGAALDNQNGGLASGATLNNAGTVNLGADDTIALLINSGNVAGAGRTLTAASYALNGGSVIDANLGTGAVTTQGSVSLNGTSAASTVQVASGTLTLGAANRLIGGATVAIAGGASLQMNGSEQVGLLVSAGHLGGAPGSTLTAPVYDLRDGAVIDANLGRGLIVSNGTVQLNGVSAAEEVAVQSGSLTLGGPDRLADYSWVDINGGARLVLANGNDVIRLLTGKGNVELRNGSVLTVHEGSYSGSASSTGALLKETTSVLTLAGDNTYEAGTLVREGVLQVAPTGSLRSDVVVGNVGRLILDGFIRGGVDVQGGGFLKGTGVIESHLASAGIVAPGASPGILTVSGNYSQSGTLEIEIDGRAGAGVSVGGHDQLKVGGRATLDPGSKLVLTRSVANGFEPGLGDRFQVIEAAGGITGSFSTLDRSAFATKLLFDYGTGYVYGTGVGSGDTFAALGGTDRNARAMATLIVPNAVIKDANQNDAFIDTRTATGALFKSLLQNRAAPEALARYAPAGYASLTEYALRATRQHADDRAGVVVAEKGWELSTGYSRNELETDNGAGEVDFKLRSQGASVAITRQVSPRVAVTAYYTRDYGAVKSQHLSYEAKGFAAGARVALARKPAGGRFSAEAGFGYGSSEFEGDRLSLASVVAGATDAKSYDLHAGSDYVVLSHKRLTLAAVAGLAHTVSYVDAFSERGGAEALRIHGMKDRLTIGELGARADLALTPRLTFSARVTQTHNFEDGRREVDASLGTARARVVAAGHKEDETLVGASLRYATTRRVSAEAYYETDLKDFAGSTVNRAGARISIRF